MQKLMAINGYWNNTYDKVFSKNDMWYGSVIMNDNGFFEGIVVDENGHYKGECLIGGRMNEDGVDAVIISSFVDIQPIVYKTKKAENGYLGSVFELDDEGREIQIGDSFIVEEENSKGNVLYMQEKIDNWKEVFMFTIHELSYMDFLNSLEKNIKKEL